MHQETFSSKKSVQSELEVQSKSKSQYTYSKWFSFALQMPISGEKTNFSKLNVSIHFLVHYLRITTIYALIYSLDFKFSWLILMNKPKTLSNCDLTTVWRIDLVNIWVIYQQNEYFAHNVMICLFLISHLMSTFSGVRHDLLAAATDRIPLSLPKIFEWLHFWYGTCQRVTLSSLVAKFDENLKNKRFDLFEYKKLEFFWGICTKEFSVKTMWKK